MHTTATMMASSTSSTVCGLILKTENDWQSDRESVCVGVCFGACDSEVFADYDMTERETRSRQTRTWCFSAWLESSATPFVFIHTVDRSSLQLPPCDRRLSLPLFFLLRLATRLCPLALLFLMPFNLCDYYRVYIARGNWGRLHSVLLRRKCAYSGLYTIQTLLVIGRMEMEPTRQGTSKW